MPVYNERDTVSHVIGKVLACAVGDMELVVVDDGSTDGTRDILRQNFETNSLVRLVYHDVNKGKGAALATGFKHAKGDIVIVQDADEEYDPSEYPKLIQPILDDRADVVFGSRFLGGPHRVLYFWHSVGNKLLTTLSNMFTDLNLTDMETCYKVFRNEVLAEIEIQEKRFGFEPEITAKVAALGYRVYEVPISYHGRTYAEGKKIGLKDAFRAVYCILKYAFVARRRAQKIVRRVS